MNIKNLLLGCLLLQFFVGCGTAVKIDSKGCVSGANWEKHRKEILDYESQYRKFEPVNLYENYDFVLKRRVNSPLGLFFPKEIFLKTILEKENIPCTDIKVINITYTNEWFDMLSSFLPFLATKTVYIYGQLWNQENRVQLGREDLNEDDLERLERLEENDKESGLEVEEPVTEEEVEDLLIQ